MEPGFVCQVLGRGRLDSKAGRENRIGMKVVSRFEARLLGILHFLLQRMPAAKAFPLLSGSERPPSALSDPAINLIKEALAKGTTWLLARMGGWRRERHLRGDRVVDGRLWERTPPAELGLTFTSEVLTFLTWLTAVDPKKLRDVPWKPQVQALTVGDLVFFFFAYAALREVTAHANFNLAAHPVFFRHGMCRLAFPADFATLQEEVRPDFALWSQGAGAWVLEVLQSFLAGKWLQLEHGKERIADFRVMRALGRSQELVLQAHGQAVETAGRLDLARFLLRTAAGLLSRPAAARDWIGGLLPVAGQRLADRAATSQAALVFLRQLERLSGWQRRARTTGYLDEGYAASQLWLADWEACQGDLLCAHAQAILRQVDPLKSHEGQT